MKSGGGGGNPVKRRWRGLVIAVIGLVFLSMLVPLVFLLGLHNGFHSNTGNLSLALCWPGSLNLAFACSDLLFIDLSPKGVCNGSVLTPPTRFSSLHSGLHRIIIFRSKIRERERERPYYLYFPSYSVENWVGANFKFPLLLLSNRLQKCSSIFQCHFTHIY